MYDKAGTYAPGDCTTLSFTGSTVAGVTFRRGAGDDPASMVDSHVTFQGPASPKILFIETVS